MAAQGEAFEAYNRAYAYRSDGAKAAKDVLIAGYDDMKYAKVLQPTLTTYRQPLLEIASMSYEMMLNRISTPHSMGADINLTGELIARESTKFR